MQLFLYGTWMKLKYCASTSGTFMKMAHVRRTVGSIYKNAQISQAVHVKSHLSYLQVH